MPACCVRLCHDMRVRFAVVFFGVIFVNKNKYDYVDPRDSNPDFKWPNYKLDDVPHPRRDGLDWDDVVTSGVGTMLCVGPKSKGDKS